VRGRRLSPEKLEAIDWIRKGGMVDKSEIKAYCMETMNKPDPEKLQEQYWNRLVNSLVGCMRKDDGTREAFLFVTNEGTKIVVLSTAKNLKALEAIKDRLDKKINGTIKSRDAVKMKIAELAGQTVLEFTKEEAPAEKPQAEENNPNAA
jgi:hypothetical protein